MNEYDEKSNIRHYLLERKPYLNLSGIAKANRITKQSLSLFLRDEYHLGSLSLTKLHEIKAFIERL